MINDYRTKRALSSSLLSEAKAVSPTLTLISPIAVLALIIASIFSSKLFFVIKRKRGKSSLSPFLVFLQAVSWEMKHNRANITEHYLK
jgi:hypothetical protein